MPFQCPGWAGYPATATFQTARVLYEDLSSLLADGIEPCRANGEAWLEVAFATDLLINDDMRLLIVFEDINAELISRVHYNFLNRHKSLRVDTLIIPSFNPFHTVEEVLALDPSSIQKISSKTLQSHCG